MITNYGGDHWEYINPFPYIYKSRFDFEFDTFKDKVDAHLAESKKVTDKQNLTTPEKNGGITSVVLSGKPDNVYPHKWTEFGSEFDEFLRDCLKTIWDERFYNQSLARYIERSWINVHYKDGYTEEHLHHGVDVACVCYLKVPDNSGGLQIKNPLSAYDTSEPKVDTYYYEGKDWVTIDVKTNDVIFFPGWLLHRTEPNKVDEGRYVMSLNVRHLN